MWWTKYTKIEPLRFLVAGAINTVFSYLIYLLALLFVKPEAAYSISFAVGALSSYTLHLTVTFRARHSRRKMLVYPLFYAAQYALGLSILVTVLGAGVAKEFAPLFVLAVNVPLSFFAGRLIMRRL